MTLKHSVSTLEKSRMILLPWIILLGLIVFTAVIWLGPKLSDWQEKKSTIKTLAKEVESLEQEKDNAVPKLIKLQKEYNTKSKPFLAKERLILPVSIDAEALASFLEIYEISVPSATGNYFELNTLSFSKTKNHKDLNIAETTLSISATGSPDGIKDFLSFMFYGQPNQDLKVAYEEDLISASHYSFLKDKKMPLNTLLQLTETPDKKSDDMTIKATYKLYSHPISNE